MSSTVSAGKPVASSNMRAAQKYAKAGYPVLLVWPLENGVCTCPKGKMCGKSSGKHPVNAAWQKTATTDVARIERMFTKMPNAHVGIMPPDGHCFIDIDPRNGGNTTVKTLLGKSKLPTNTPIQNSGGGGLHLVFKGEPTGKIGKGVDIKLPHRGFVVAWPSVHVSGGAYKWRDGAAPWDVKPLPLPEELTGTETLHEYDPDTIPTAVPLETLRAALAHIPADDYQRWINIGQALRHTYGDEGEEIWEDWSRTSPKFKDGDERRWDTFDRNRDRPLITIRSVMSIARKSGYRPLTAEFNDSLWIRGDISGYVDSDAPPIDWVFEPCIPGGKVCLLAGAGGSSKSFLTLTLAMQLAIMQDFGPFKPTKPGKALLLVGEESGDDVHRRVQAVFSTRMFDAKQRQQIADRVGVVPVRGLDWRLVYHDDAGDLQETDRIDYLIEEIKSLGDVRFVVLDPLVSFNGANENDNVEMARLMFSLDRIASATGAAVLVIHHVSKGGQVTSLQDATQAVIRGASALVDNARSAILLTRMPRADAPLYNLREEDAGRYVVARVVKNNYGPHTPDVILAIEKDGSLRHAPEVTKVHNSVSQATRQHDETDVPLRLLGYIKENSELSQTDMAALIGRSQSMVNKVLHTLLMEELVVREGVGPGTRYTLTKRGNKKLAQVAPQDRVEDAEEFF